MLAKPDTCKACPLYGDGMGFVPDRLVEGAAVLYLAQNPGEDEEHGRRLVSVHGRKRDGVYEAVPPQPLIGPTGKMLREEFLPLAGLSPASCSYANVLRCRDGHPRKDGRWIKTNTMPIGERLTTAIACCSQYMQVPSSVKLIVAAGAYSWEFTQGKGHSLAAWRGYCGPSKVNGVPVFATLHPASLFRSPKMKLACKKDFQRIRRFLKGEWPLPLPEGLIAPQEVPWETALACIGEASPSFLVIDTEYEWGKGAIPGHHPLWVLGVAFRGADGGIQCVQVDCRQMTEEQVRACLARFAAICRRVPCVFQNAAADMPVLEFNGGLPREEYYRVEDLLLIHASLWSEQPHDLAYLKSIVGVLGEPKDFAHGQKDLVRYNRGDLVDTLVAYEVFKQELEVDPGALHDYRERLIPLIAVHTRATEEGIAVNKACVLPALKQQIATMQEAVKIARAYVGFPISLGSVGPTGQVARVVYGLLRAKPRVHKKTKKITVNDDAVAQLRGEYLAVDAEEERQSGLSVERVLRRVDEGANPVLEARVLYSTALQEISHYLAPLVRGPGGKSDDSSLY